MAKPNTEEPVKKYQIYEYSLLKSYGVAKESEIKASIAQQNLDSLLPSDCHTRYSFNPYKHNANEGSSSYNKKLLLHKTNHISISDKNTRDVINQSKHVLQKSQNSNNFFSATKNSPKTNVIVKNAQSIEKKGLPPDTSDAAKEKLLAELTLFTSLLKKATSENRICPSATTNKNKVQSKLVAPYNTNAFNKYKMVNKSNVFSKTKNETVSLTKLPGNISKCNNVKEMEWAKKLNPASSSHYNFNKYSYKKSYSNISNKPFTAVENKDLVKNVLPKRLVELSLNKTDISKPENVQNKLLSLPDKQNLTITLNTDKNSVLKDKLSTKSLTVAKVKTPIQLNVQTSSIGKLPKTSKLKCISSIYTKVNKHSINPTDISKPENVQNKLPSLPDKQNLTITLNTDKNSILKDKLNTKSLTVAKVKTPIQLNVKTSSIGKLPKTSKLKCISSRYTKVNKHLINPTTNSLKSVTTPKSVKKTYKKVNTKYKVVNKNRTPLNKKSSSIKAKENSSSIVDETNLIIQKASHAEEKLEKNLLVFTASLCTAATPVSSKVSFRTEPNSITKVNPKSRSHKMSLKKTNARVSKYKIVNSKKTNARVSKYKIVNSSNLQNCPAAKKQNTAIFKNRVKKVSCSKYKLVNKNQRPLQVLTPQWKPILVKRLFKSKNALVNKNASPTNFSAKMIKSKYLTLNKRKYHFWQKKCLYTEVPSQHRELREYLKTKSPLNGQFQKAVMKSWKRTRVFSRYRSQVLNKQFCKNSTMRKLKNGYGCSPVVFIRGMKYSTNSTGKTLKKLPIRRGHLTKIVRKSTVGRKAIMKTPQNLKWSRPASKFRKCALNRSINRINFASTKKNLIKVNAYCMFYNRFGRCNKGVKCTYIHDPSKIAVCTRFLRGTCKVDGCPFSHEIAPGKMAHCSFFLIGACENANCPYRHEKLSPDAELCKAFVQGYCPEGKECKKAHILVCPKYVQGECDKGSSCAYPHPPKKVKKNVLKEDKVEKKPEDVFMDVARYYQIENSLSCGNKSNECVINQYVPKNRKLEVQPSFIPLCDTPKTSTC